MIASLNHSGFAASLLCRVPAGLTELTGLRVPLFDRDSIGEAGQLTCALLGITLDHLPRDTSLGRVRRFAKGAYLWQADDAADRIYFLRRGRVVIMTARPHERPVALRTIQPDQPFGELCLCSVRTGVRGTTACALIASEAFEIKLGSFVGYLHQNRVA